MNPDLIRKVTLDNGLRIISEYIPSVRSVSVGFWILGGSRIEKPEESGITHFIEHILFKGTAKRNAYQIAQEIDSLGGHLDAFTSREHTCLMATVLDEHLPKAIDILTDQVKNSLFPEEEIERERKVILEEINMIEDTPDEYVHDLCIQNFWPDQAMGRSVIGLREDVQGFRRDDLLTYFHQKFQPDRIIVSAAGNIQLDSFQDLIIHSNLFSESLGKGDNSLIDTPVSHHQVACFPKDLEQIHICLLMEGLSQNHRLRYAGYLLNSILGGGMSSRLFQKVREQRGLAYSVFSSAHSYQDVGLISVYAGTGPDTFLETIQLIIDELNLLKKEGLVGDELERARNQLKGNIMLGLESTANRMSKLARQEIYFGRSFSLNEILNSIEAVTEVEIIELANMLFSNKKIGLTVLGQVGRDQLRADSLDLGA